MRIDCYQNINSTNSWIQFLYYIVCKDVKKYSDKKYDSFISNHQITASLKWFWFWNAVWNFFENLSVLVPYIILNVMDVFLPEVTLLVDKRLHHLNTRAILKDQGKLYGFVLLISNCFINLSAITCLTITPSGWSMIKCVWWYPDWKCPWPEVGELEPPGRPSHPQQRRRSWRSPQPPLWAWYVSTITSSEYLLIL